MEAPLESRQVPSTRVPPTGVDWAFERTGNAKNTQKMTIMWSPGTFAERIKMSIIQRLAGPQRRIMRLRNMWVHHNSQRRKLTIEVSAVSRKPMDYAGMLS